MSSMASSPSVPSTDSPHDISPMGVTALSSPDSPISASFDFEIINNDNDVLCGWIYKARPEANPLSTADRPKKRWFIFNESTYELEYYRNPKDLNRLGSISIYDAAFTPEAVRSLENLYSMDITTSKKTYRLLHEERSTLDFWRQALQKKRSAMQEALLNEIPINSTYMQGKDSPEKKSNVGSTKGITTSESLSTLAPHLEVEPTVHESNRFVGPHTKTSMHSSLSDVSVRNLTIEARNTFRNLFRSGAAPLTQLISGSDRAEGGHSNGSQMNQSRDSFATSQFNVGRYGSTTSSSAIKTKGECDTCRELRGNKQDLEDHLKACRVQMDSLKMTLRLLTVDSSGNSSHHHDIPDGIKRRLYELEFQCNELKNEVMAREEVIADRDKQLMRLLNENDEMQRNPHLESELRGEFGTMRQERDAYLDQNKSLNAEILNLRLLYSASVEHEREMIDAIRKLHDIYRGSSLRLKQRVEELSRPQLGGVSEPSEKDKLEMLTDAINEIDPGEPSFPENLRMVLLEVNGELTDEYGFYVERRELDSQQMIDLTTLGPDVNISYFLETPVIDYEVDASLTAKWERYIDENGLGADEPLRPLKKTLELKQLLRQGCTIKVRPRIWKAMILFYVNHFRQENGGAAIYRGLVEQQRASSFSMEKKQIELDINRSLPENKYFNITRTKNVDELKISSLKRILLSFCEISDKVGYCQGLDRLAATLLLNVDEEMSFWGLHVIVRRLRSENYYTSALRDAQIDQRVFKDLIASHVPHVSQRLSQMDVDVSLFSFNWFLTLFVDGFHWSIFMKIWDSFLFEGDKVLFRYAIAVVIYLEPILMRVEDVPSLYKVLRNAGRYIKDHRRLTEIAFCSLKSFPKRRITQKRLHYSIIVDKEIARVTEERARMREKSSREDMFTRESEDEDYQDVKLADIED